LRPLETGTSQRPSPVLLLAQHPLADLVALVFRHLALDTVAASTPDEARSLMRRQPALVVIDTSIRGAEAMLGMGNHHATLALIDLARQGSSYRAFSEGADQVVRVPFTPDELAVRAAALMRRRGTAIRLTHVVGVADGQLSLDERLHVGSDTVFLGPTLNSLLYLLVAHANEYVPREDMRRYVWGLEPDTSDADVDRLVADLSRILSEHDGQRWVIESRENGAWAALRRVV